MIERDFIKRKMNENRIEEYITNRLNKAGYSHIEIQRTPLGEKVIIYTSRPGLIVGAKGANIQEITETLKREFNLETPQVEVAELQDPNLDVNSVARHIVHTFEKFGPRRFKAIGYKVLQDIINAGALGAEIVIGGRGVPSSRAKSWRFKEGHLKKSGNISENHVLRGHAVAHLKSGSVGVKVTILSPDTRLPDKIVFRELEVKKEEVKEEKEKPAEKKKSKKKEVKENSTEEKKEVKEKKKPAKKTVKNKVEQGENNGDNKE